MVNIKFESEDEAIKHFPGKEKVYMKTLGVKELVMVYKLNKSSCLNMNTANNCNFVSSYIKPNTIYLYVSI